MLSVIKLQKILTGLTRGFFILRYKYICSIMKTTKIIFKFFIISKKENKNFEGKIYSHQFHQRMGDPNKVMSH